MILEIIKKTAKPFQTEEGKVDYYWYVAKQENGMAIRFGSTEGGHNIGDKNDVLLEKYEQSNGKWGFKEVL